MCWKLGWVAGGAGGKCPEWLVVGFRIIGTVDRVLTMKGGLDRVVFNAKRVWISRWVDVSSRTDQWMVERDGMVAVGACQG